MWVAETIHCKRGKAVGSNLISTEDGKDEIRKIGALIRESFKVDPYRLSEEKFIQLGQEALFLRDFNAKLIENVIDDKLEQLFVALLKTLSALR